MPSGFALVQAGFFNPVIETLRQAGANSDSMLRRSGLARFDLGDSEHYVPAGLLYGLLHDITRAEGIDSFFEVFAPALQLQNLCNLGKTVYLMPDMLTACRVAIRYQDVFHTFERLRLDVDGPRARIAQCYLDAAQPGREVADLIAFCYLLDGVRQLGGAEWAPFEIHLQSRVRPDFEHLLPGNSTTRIRLGQPMTAITFPTAMLTLPMPGYGAPANGLDAVQPAPRTLPQIIEALLESSAGAPIANMTLLADLLDISPRNLRRQLAELETSFSEVVEGWRFKTALALLADPRRRVGEIAAWLGYANPPNFERAFRRWTGTSPGAYRDRL